MSKLQAGPDDDNGSRAMEVAPMLMAPPSVSKVSSGGDRSTNGTGLEASGGGAVVNNMGVIGEDIDSLNEEGDVVSMEVVLPFEDVVASPKTPCQPQDKADAISSPSIDMSRIKNMARLASQGEGFHVKLGTIDAYAGTGLVGHLIEHEVSQKGEYGAPDITWEVTAMCENDAKPREWLQHLYSVRIAGERSQHDHSKVLLAGDATSSTLGWKAWSKGMLPPHTVLVTGGTPCPPFSKAGPQRTYNDPRAALMHDPLDMAVALGLPCIVQENVAPLVDEDATGKSHGCLTRLIEDPRAEDVCAC